MDSLSDNVNANISALSESVNANISALSDSVNAEMFDIYWYLKDHRSLKPTYYVRDEIIHITVPSGMILTITIEQQSILISSANWGFRRFEFKYYGTFEKTMNAIMDMVVCL